MMTREVYHMPLCNLKKLSPSELAEISQVMHHRTFAALLKAWGGR